MLPPEIRRRQSLGFYVALQDAVAANRDIMGATDPKKAAAGTIRKDFAESIEANSVHGSDSAENAATEIAFFFAGVDIVP